MEAVVTDNVFVSHASDQATLIAKLPMQVLSSQLSLPVRKHPKRRTLEISLPTSSATTLWHLS